MAVATQYPSPFPSYTEQHLDGSSSADVYGPVPAQNMAHWTGGPPSTVTPLAMPTVHPPSTSEEEHTHYSQPPVIHRVGHPENYLLTNMNSSFVVPSSSPIGSTDSSMQVFQQNFGSGFAFYDSVPGAGMPEGFYTATREGLTGADMSALGVLGQTEVRKATKKQIQINAVTEATQPQSNKQPEPCPPRARIEKKKFFPCC